MRLLKPTACALLALVLVVLLAGQVYAVKPPVREWRNWTMWGDPDWVEHCREREETQPTVTEEYGFEQAVMRVITGFIFPRSLFSKGVGRRSLSAEKGQSAAEVSKTMPAHTERSRLWSGP